MRGVLRCSFCGKSQDEVATLVSGPGPVFICNECHALITPIMARAAPPAPERTIGPAQSRRQSPAIGRLGTTLSGHTRTAPRDPSNSLRSEEHATKQISDRESAAAVFGYLAASDVALAAIGILTHKLSS